MAEDLTQEEGMAVLGWAHRAGAAVVLMHHHPAPTTAREGMQLLNNMRETIESMYNDMPEVLFDAACDLAETTLEAVNQEEELIEEFVQEVESYGKDS